MTGTLVHGCYLGGVFAAIENGLSAGLIALVVSLQPVLTSTLANRWLGERVLPRQWLGLLLGVAGVYLIVQEKMATGETTLLAWLFAVVALCGITVGTLPTGPLNAITDIAGVEVGHSTLIGDQPAVVRTGARHSLMPPTSRRPTTTSSQRLWRPTRPKRARKLPCRPRTISRTPCWRRCGRLRDHPE